MLYIQSNANLILSFNQRFQSWDEVNIILNNYRKDEEKNDRTAFEILYKMRENFEEINLNKVLVVWAWIQQRSRGWNRVTDARTVWETRYVSNRDVYCVQFREFIAIPHPLETSQKVAK